jgi:hypothetical protein
MVFDFHLVIWGFAFTKAHAFLFSIVTVTNFKKASGSGLGTQKTAKV